MKYDDVLGHLSGCARCHAFFASLREPLQNEGFLRNGDVVQGPCADAVATAAEAHLGFGWPGGRCPGCQRMLRFEEYRNTAWFFLALS